MRSHPAPHLHPAPHRLLALVALGLVLGSGSVGCSSGDRSPDDDDLLPPRDVHVFPPPRWTDGPDRSDRPGQPPLPPETTAEPIPPEREPPTQTPLTLAAVHAGILQPSCGTCHIEASPPAGGLYLALDAGLPDRLLAPSIQLPAMARIRPGDPDASYLLHKVDGTHENVGGTGERCPLGGPPLSTVLRDRLVHWIDQQPDPQTLR